MHQKPHILLVAPYGFNDRMTNFIEFVTGRILAANGFRVRALTRKEHGASDAIEGVMITRYGTTLSGILALLSIFWNERPDVIHVHNLRNNRVGTFAAILANVFRIPLFFTEYGLGHDHYLAEDREDPLSHRLFYDRIIGSLTQLIPWILNDPLRIRRHLNNYLWHYPLFHADTVVFVSKHNVPIAQKLGVKNAIYLPQVMDEVRWNKETLTPHPLLDQLKALPGPRALFVGQMKERKGWDIYLKAIADVPESIVPTFILATQSDDTAKCEAMIQEFGLQNRVILAKHPPRAVLQKMFEEAALIIVPSRYEGFGLVPLEAFDRGKAVVASRAEALTDYLIDDENAVLVEPKNPEALAQGIIRLLRNAALQEKIIKGGKSTLEKMRSPSEHQRWIGLYTEALTK